MGYQSVADTKQADGHILQGLWGGMGWCTCGRVQREGLGQIPQSNTSKGVKELGSSGGASKGYNHDERTLTLKTPEGNSALIKSINQTGKDKYMILLIGGTQIKKKDTNELMYRTEIDPQT